MQNKLVTIIGGGGFVGRYVAQHLLSHGARVRIAERDPSNAMHIKPLGNSGQTQFVQTNVTNKDSVARAIQGSDAVINLVGILKGDLQNTHVTGARNIAEAAAEARCSTLIHVSAIGADSESVSKYGRSKGDGEAAVRTAFPNATIIRPSIIFGREDQFVNKFASMISTFPVVPIIGGATKFQPIYVDNVARAITSAISDSKSYAGRVFELGGPEVMSMAELNSWIAKATGRSPNFVSVPNFAAKALAIGLGWLPGAPITLDQFKMLSVDNVVGPKAEGLNAFGISPTPLAAVAHDWLVAYRAHGRFGAKAKTG